MNAYSHLKRLLKQRRMTVPELHRRMRTQGLYVNVKSLYRLSNDNQPVDRLDMHVAGAICQVCAVPLSDWIVFEAELGTLRTLAPETQIRLDDLMTKNNAGSLADREREELRALVREAEEITIANARLLAQQQQQLEPGVYGARLAR
jgi:hypothetical protein